MGTDIPTSARTLKVKGDVLGEIYASMCMQMLLLQMQLAVKLKKKVMAVGLGIPAKIWSLEV